MLYTYITSLALHKQSADCHGIWMLQFKRRNTVCIAVALQSILIIKHIDLLAICHHSISQHQPGEDMPVLHRATQLPVLTHRSDDAYIMALQRRTVV